MAAGMKEEIKDRWERLISRMRSLVPLPVIALAIVVVSLAAWLGSVAAWRAALFVFKRYLEEPW